MNNQAMAKMGFTQESKYKWICGYYTYYMNFHRLEYYKNEFNQLSLDTIYPDTQILYFISENVTD